MRLLPLFMMALGASAHYHNSQVDSLQLYKTALSQKKVDFSRMSCTSCLNLVETIQTIANSPLALQVVIEFLDSTICAKVFPANSTGLAGCEKIVTDIVDLLPLLNNGVSQLGWDANAVCSTVIEVCPQPCCNQTHPVYPEQVHLAWTGSDLSEMAVTWVTLNPVLNPVVQYGPASGAKMLRSYPSTSTGSNRTYTQGYWIGQIYNAVMTGLVPGETYNYRVGDLTTGVFSQQFTFTVLPPTAGTVERPLRFIQIGDMEFGNNSDATVASMINLVKNGNIDFIFHNGDVSYADAYMIHWDAFWRKVQPMASTIPYMTSVGNHEFYYNFTAYKARTYMPGKGSNSQDGMFYSMNINSALHLSVFNTESIIDTAYIGSENIAFLQQDLENAPSQAAFVIASGHRPLYCSDGGTQCDSFAAFLRAQAENIFYKKADIVIGSHEHSYERTYPVYQSNATALNYNDPQAPIYIINGAAGNREGNHLPSSPQPWSAFTNANIGYSVVEIAGNQLSWVHYDSATNAVLDSWGFTKQQK